MYDQTHERGANPAPAVLLSDSLCSHMIPGTRLELVYPEGWGILSPLRLPIPPPGQVLPQSIVHGRRSESSRGMATGRPRADGQRGSSPPSVESAPARV